MNALFEVHRLNAKGAAQAGAIASAFNELLIQLQILCPDSREFSLAKTKLEEAAFFAKKSIAVKLENQENA